MNKINLLFEGKPIATGTKVHGVAVHTGKTEHKKDKETQFNDTRVYLQEYLKAAAPTLVGKPIFLNHDPKQQVGTVTLARWDETANGIYYEGTITADVAPRIDSGEITAVSVGLNPWIEGGGVLWKDGFAPINYVFEELSLIDPHIMEPGDPNAWIKLQEAISKSKQDELVEQLQKQVPDEYLKNPIHIITEKDREDMKEIIRLANEITATKECIAQAEKQVPEHRHGPNAGTSVFMGTPPKSEPEKPKQKPYSDLTALQKYRRRRGG